MIEGLIPFFVIGGMLYMFFKGRSEKNSYY